MQQAVGVELAFVLEEVFNGHKTDAVFLDDASLGILDMLEGLTPEEASAPVAGASVAAHARHVSHSLMAYLLAVKEEDPRHISDNWPEWTELAADAEEWRCIRRNLNERYAGLRDCFAAAEKDFKGERLRFALGGLAHMAFHLGIIQVKYDVLKGNA